jgi:hypothetical protein
MSEQNRVIQYQTLKSNGDLNQTIKNFTEFNNSYYSSESSSNRLFDWCLVSINKVTSDYYWKKTFKDYVKTFACDLQWAKDAGYCETSNQQGGGNQGGGNQGGSSSSYSSCNISSSDIENGTTVSKGVKCSIVGDIQRALQKHCYSLRDDNMFGPVTEGKVEDFQKSKGISPANGVVDSETWEELQKSPSSPCSSGRSGGSRRKSRDYEQDGGEEDVQIIDL